MTSNQEFTCFSTQEIAKLYVNSRAKTPGKLFDHMISYFSQESNCFDNALDIGCGSGQSTLKLAEYFNKVTGVDVNEVQIEQVPSSHPSNINFVVADVQKMDFCEDASVDMITASSMLHWVPNKEKLYSEAKRVLKINGVFAVTAYSYPDHKNTKASDFMKEWLDHHIIKPDLVPPGYLDLLTLYADIKLPFRDTKRVDIEVSTVWTVDQFMQFMESTGLVEYLLRKNPKSNALDELKEGLHNIYTSNGKLEDLELAWPYYLLLGRK